LPISPDAALRSARIPLDLGEPCAARLVQLDEPAERQRGATLPEHLLHRRDVVSDEFQVQHDLVPLLPLMVRDIASRGRSK
jgi:hypothetical protein